MAGDEENHISDFEAIGTSLKKDFTPDESYTGEYEEYLKAIIDSHVFNVNNVDDLPVERI